MQDLFYIFFEEYLDQNQSALHKSGIRWDFVSLVLIKWVAGSSIRWRSRVFEACSLVDELWAGSQLTDVKVIFIVLCVELKWHTQCSIGFWSSTVAFLRLFPAVVFLKPFSVSIYTSYHDCPVRVVTFPEIALLLKTPHILWLNVLPFNRLISVHRRTWYLLASRMLGSTEMAGSKEPWLLNRYRDIGRRAS